MRRWFGVVLVALLLAAVAPAYAIPAEFTAWLYTPDTGEMSLIDLSGVHSQPRDSGACVEVSRLQTVGGLKQQDGIRCQARIFQLLRESREQVAIRLDLREHLGAEIFGFGTILQPED